MITLTRRLAGTLKSIFRAACNLSTRGPFPPVSIEGGKDGIRIRCRTADASAEYSTADRSLPEKISVPLALLAECAANCDQLFTLEQTANGIFTRWQDAAVPQVKRYDSVELGEETWPDAPEPLGENSSQLLACLNDACQVTDPESSRYALGCLQLTGEGRIAATDGRQLLVQQGFTFPWEGEVLLPANKLFGCKHLPQHESAYIGKHEEWLTLRIGNWTFQFKLHEDGRFPRVDGMLRSAESATASFVLPPADREFLCKNLPHLPGNEDFSAAVTVDLNGKVAVRAKATDSESITELVLTGATRTGEQVRFQTNRKYLTRALQLGFEHVRLISPSAPAFCFDANRHYLWALLEPTGALQPTPDAILIESPSPLPGRPNRISPAMMRSSMNTHPNTDGSTQVRRQRSHAVPPRAPASAAAPPDDQNPSGRSAFDRAVALHSTLRDVASDMGELVRTLKREKKQHRAVRSTLLSLKQLQAIDA